MTRDEFIRVYHLDITTTQLKAWFLKKGYLYQKKDKIAVGEKGHCYVKLKSVTFGDFLAIQSEKSADLALLIQRDITQKKWP